MQPARRTTRLSIGLAAVAFAAATAATAAQHLWPRADERDRAGAGTGRVYTIACTASDSSANSAAATARVVVPHDMGR